MSPLSLFMVSVVVFLGIVLTLVYGNSGVLLNLLFLIFVTLGERFAQIRESELLFIVLFSLGIVGTSLLLEKFSRKVLGLLPYREVLLGGSIFSLLVGMGLRPAFMTGALGTVFSLPLVRRLFALGLKALLLTFGAWLSRSILVTGLNIWFLIKHF